MQIVINAAVASELQNATQPVELCDPSGRVLGRFMPLIDLSKWEAVSTDARDEELLKRTNSSENRYSTAEVLARLEEL